MKVTVTWLKQYLPFTAQLLVSAGLTGRRKVSLAIKTTQVSISPPGFDGMSRFTSMGYTAGKQFTHYAGSDASIANRPTELLADACPFDGKMVNPGCYYAVLDLHEYYGVRHLTIYLNESDLTMATPELKNQLQPWLPDINKPKVLVYPTPHNAAYHEVISQANDCGPSLISEKSFS